MTPDASKRVVGASWKSHNEAYATAATLPHVSIQYSRRRSKGTFNAHKIHQKATTKGRTKPYLYRELISHFASGDKTNEAHGMPRSRRFAQSPQPRPIAFAHGSICVRHSKGTYLRFLT